MQQRSKQAWRLTAVSAAILAIATALSGSVHYSIPLSVGVVFLWFASWWLLKQPLRKGMSQQESLVDELRDAKEYLERTIEHSADIIISVNSEGLIETFNRGGEESLGYNRAEVIGRPIESLYVDPSERHAAFALLEVTGHLKNYETRMRAKDGRVVNILLTLSILPDSDGRSIGTIGISKDITQRKKLLDELRDAKEYLEGIVEYSPDLIITAAPDGLIETFNRGAEKALGYSRSEVIGRPMESLYVDPREMHAAATCLEESGLLKNYETRLRAKDGEVVNILLTLSCLRDREGEPIGTIGISKDITQRKKLQSELHDTREHLEGAIEHSADMIITVNSEKLIQTFNRGGEELLGYRRDEVIGKPIESLYVDPRERHEAIALLEESGHLKNYETRLKASDDRVVNILLTLSLLHDRENRPIGTIGISKDITQRKKLQDQLRDAKEYLEGIVENSSDIIITVTPDGLIETFNRGAERALGYSRTEVIGRRIETLFADPRERDIAIDQLKNTDNVENYETRLLTKSGEERIALLTLSRLRDREGNPIGTFGISKDITKRRKLERELLQSQKYAAIGQAVTRIQHAIKNMLNSLKGGAYLVRVGMAKDNRTRIEEGWLMVEEGISRISGLSYNMLNFAKEWKPNLEEADLGELMVKICEQNRQAAADHGVRLHQHVSEGLPPVVCDSKLIHMATTDIVVNAIDACIWKDYGSEEAPEVLLETSAGECGDCFVIEVRDNGCGMSEEVKQNIFTPFFSTKESQGTGLGLAVTDKIIKVHEGDISVESEPERGTTFRIRIPTDGPGSKRGGIDGQVSSRG